jgi:hypothetical protein
VTWNDALTVTSDGPASTVEGVSVIEERSGASVSGSATEVTLIVGRLAAGIVLPFNRFPALSSMARMSSFH